MSHKVTLPVITILIAAVCMQFWSREPAASKVNAQADQQSSPVVSFDRAVVNVTEPDTGENLILTLNVVISEAPEQGVKTGVRVQSANGNALAGMDYEPVSEYLTFPAGSTDPQSLDIVILGNSRDQPDRAFVVFLTNPENAKVSSPASTTIYIIDNDPPGWNYLPIIRGFTAGPTRTPPPTATPCYGYC